MQDFKLKFGKYKGMQIFNTPVNYYQWLVEQKFTAPKEDYENLKVGDEVVVNYRFFVFPDRKPRYQVVKGVLKTIKDKYVVVHTPQELELFNVETQKIYITNKGVKTKLLKSTIASIELNNQ